MAGRKSTALMELAIGATIILGVIVLIAMLMVWGNSTSFLGGHYRVVVNMANVGGLKEGAPVKMGGFQIGRVATIQIRPRSTELEIVLDIDEAHLLPEGSTAKVSTAGLVGDAFMEIVPGKSETMIKQAASAADAERLESSPLPDMSELMAKVNDIGVQVTVLTANLNDIVGDMQFKKSLKSMATNLDNVSYQANLILQRGQGVIDNVNLASQNAAALSTTLKERVDTISGSADKLLTLITSRAEGTIDNINAGVTDVRNAVNSTLGNPAIAKNLAEAITNINSVTTLLAKRNDATERLIENLSELSGDLKAVTAHVRSIAEQVEPESVASTLNKLNAAIGSMTDMMDKVKAEPVLALSINKAADRIVKMKFDELAKQRVNSSDATLDEINRWVRESMDQGMFDDPIYSEEVRPYVLPESAAPQATGSSATERVPYLID